MDKILATVIILTFGIITTKAQCVTDYTYSGTNDTITFTNNSTVSNAHFYWNFGDGSGSNDFSPMHVFPDDGRFLVTLYGLDTISNCVSTYETWIDVIKPDIYDCNLLFTDTIIGGYLQTTSFSNNCAGVHIGCHVAGPAQNICSSINLGNWGKSLFLHGMRASTSDSIYGSRILKEYYKTLPHKYTASHNYQDCSANFEVLINYQANAAIATFTAMNKNATSYRFYVTGFGNPILLNGRSVSFSYSYINYLTTRPSIIYLITNDTINHCADTVIQQILVRNPNYTFPVSCYISSPPQNQIAAIGTNAQFTISASPEASFQWQQDAGLGFVNLTNAGPYSGVTTNTLTINNVQLTMNNYFYRCIVYDNSGGCHNTSPPASLNGTVGIKDMEINNLNIYPNPVTDYLTISIPGSQSKLETSIFNLLGELVLFQNSTEQETTLDVSNLVSGVYVVELKLGNKTSIRKIVIGKNKH